MKTIKTKVEATLAYAAFFKFPLTPDEVWRWLVTDVPVTLTRVRAVLPRLTPKLRRWLKDKPSAMRHYRQRISQTKALAAQRVARVIAALPGIKLVALTGSAAVGNSRAGDDLDLMIVTTTDSLWLLRPLVILVTEIFFQRRHPKQGRQLRNAVCLNLWLDETALAVPSSKRNLYTAHEVLQLQPLVNRQQTYERFLAANRWSEAYLANAFEEKTKLYPSIPATISPAPKPWSRLNQLAFWFQYRYMKAKITKETVGLHAAYFHPRNWQPAIGRYLKTKAGVK